MNIDEIKSFLTIAKSNSMTEAAEKLHITQPALSTRIMSLEKTLGGKLFVRGKGQRSIILTDLGTNFFLIAERWEDLWEETQSLKSQVNEKTLYITTGKTSSIYIMPRVYARFLNRNYPVRLQLRESHYLESYKLVEDKKVDMAFVSGVMAYKNVTTIPIYSERMVFLCGKNSSYTGQIHPKDLDPYKCFDTDWSTEYRQWHSYWFSGKKSRVFGSSLRLGEVILENTDFWAIAPLSIAGAMSKHADIRYLELAEDAPIRTIYLLTLEPQNSYTKDVIDDMQHVLSELSG